MSLRRLLPSLLVLLALHPAAAGAASSQEIVRDACDDSVVDGTYSAAEIARAIRSISADTSDYTDCADVLRAAQVAAARRQSSERGATRDGGGAGRGARGTGGSATGSTASGAGVDEAGGSGGGGRAVQGEERQDGATAAAVADTATTTTATAAPQPGFPSAAELAAAERARADAAGLALDGERLDPAAARGDNGLPAPVLLLLGALLATAAFAAVQAARRDRDGDAPDAEPA